MPVELRHCCTSRKNRSVKFPKPSTAGNVDWVRKWQLQLLILCICAAEGVYGQVRYSIPEEMVKGSFVGNIAEDLGLDVKRLRSVSPCSLHFQIILDNPMELHRVDVEILDVNDNAPVFPKKQLKLNISEGAVSGARFVLESAEDPDVGVNTLQSYALSPTDHFTLKHPSRTGGARFVEMVLQTGLDREKQEEHTLVLTAFDGGSPQKSGTVKIIITVSDANDNAPVFSQAVYKASLAENAPKGTHVLNVSATDADNGVNAEVRYSFSGRTVVDLFHINTYTGQITVNGNLDFETSKQYEINVMAVDPGDLTDSCKVVIDIIDVNDNAPVITLMSFSKEIPEDSAPGTVIAMLNIKDVDSGKNGQVKCFISAHLPFQVKSSSSNFYTLISDRVLDREKVPEYNITITAVDEGSPPYSTNKTLTLKLIDVNDNAPVFQQKSYTVQVVENNPPGSSLLAVKADDADSHSNKYVSYILMEKEISGMSASSFISVNAESGVIHAVRSFDFEQMKDFQVYVKAQDGGSPPLSS
ncbi:hypothetical protein Z043_125715, partial [Scleropages formosus]